MLAKIAIIGKPNVGKSTLFNRMCGKRLAIVHDRPGVTRDTKSFQTQMDNLKLKIFDTAGLELKKEDLSTKMVENAVATAKEADLILFVVDARHGINTDDYEFARIVRKLGKKVLLLANKAEGRTAILDKDIAKIGFGDAVFVSAEHNIGFAELEEAIKTHIAKTNEVESISASEPLAQQPANDFLKLAIIGRPNVGKSSLFNRILGNERSIVSDVSGTTRDAIAEIIDINNKKIEIVDTAGMRRKARVQDSVENLSIAESINALRRSNVVALIIDAMQPLEKQDLTLANLAIHEGKGILLVVNKADLIKERKSYEKALNELIEKNLFDIKGVPVVYVSALENNNINAIFKTTLEVEKKWRAKLKTTRLNEWLKRVQEAHIPPIAKNGRRVRLKYITQTSTKPPTLTIFANIPAQLPNSYTRYLYNSLRESFDLGGIPIRIKYKKNDNPFD